MLYLDKTICLVVLIVYITDLEVVKWFTTYRCGMGTMAVHFRLRYLLASSL